MGDADKEPLYDRFIEYFDKAFQGDEIERIKIPYDKTFLPAIKIPPANEKKRHRSHAWRL